MSMESIWYKITIIFTLRGESRATFKESIGPHMHTDVSTGGRLVGAAIQSIISPWRHSLGEWTEGQSGSLFNVPSSPSSQVLIITTSHLRLYNLFWTPFTAPHQRLALHKQTAGRKEYRHLTYTLLHYWKCRNF